MNTGRFVGAAVGIWVVRVALNWTFYTRVVGRQMEQINAAHPDMFRTVIPAYIVTDLLFAVVFALLFVKAGAVLGGGLKAGMVLGVFVAILSPVVGNLYEYYSVTYLPVGLMAAVSIFQVIAHAVEGGVAGLIYKT
jgi:hypothetical protein